MPDDPKENLSASLSLAGPAAALEALRHAIAWAALSLSTEIGDDDAAAFQCVIGLDDALSGLGTLQGLVPGIVALAAPGRTVQERIAERQAALGRQQSELAAERAALETVGHLERQLKQTGDKRDQLQARISMLERQQQLAADLPALQARLTTLRKATDAITAGTVDQVADGLVTAIRQVKDLTEEQRALVDSELSKLADDAVAAGQALANERKRRDKLKADVTARQAEAEQLQRECAKVLPDLERYRAADQAVADGLTAAEVPPAGSVLDRVHAELTDVTGRLSRLDGLLKPLLDEHARVYADALRIRNWSS